MVYSPGNYIHPSFVHGKNLKIGKFNHIHEGVKVGDDVTIRSYVELRKGTIVGDGCYIDSGVKSSGQCTIGDNVTIRYNSIIARNVTIKDDVFISPQVMFINIPFTKKERRPTIVGKGAKIGTNATINDGVKIGDGVIIGAKSFVNRDCIEPGTYVGIPARKITSGISPKAHIDSDCIIGKGCRIEAGVVIGSLGLVVAHGKTRRPSNGIVILEDGVDISANTVIHRGEIGNTIIGRGSFIGSLCNIGHDVKIGRNCLIGPECVLCGHVEIGDKSYIAPFCTIKERIKIGQKAFIGLGALVIDDIPDKKLAYGHPAKIHGKNPRISLNRRAIRYLKNML